MVLPLLIGLGTAAIGAHSASKAARAQEKTGDQQVALGREQLAEGQRQFDLTMARNREVYDDQINRLAPYANSTSQKALLSEFGLANAPRGYTGFEATPFQREEFTTSPGYQFALDESSRAIEGSAAARGQLFSGRTLNALQNNAQGLANTAWAFATVGQLDAVLLRAFSRAAEQRVG